MLRGHGPSSRRQALSSLFNHEGSRRVAARNVALTGGHRETPPPKAVSASGSGRCRAPGRIEHRRGANLSDAPYHPDRAVRRWRYNRCHCPHCGGAHVAHARQQIIVENIVGAGGTVGSTRAMRSNPDGYTIEMGQMGTHAAAVALYPNLAYKPDVDFEPIGMVSAITFHQRTSRNSSHS